MGNSWGVPVKLPEEISENILDTIPGAVVEENPGEIMERNPEKKTKKIPKGITKSYRENWRIKFKKPKKELEENQGTNSRRNFRGNS